MIGVLEPKEDFKDFNLSQSKLFELITLLLSLFLSILSLRAKIATQKVAIGWFG